MLTENNLPLHIKLLDCRHLKPPTILYILESYSAAIMLSLNDDYLHKLTTLVCTISVISKPKIKQSFIPDYAVSVHEMKILTKQTSFTTMSFYQLGVCITQMLV